MRVQMEASRLMVTRGAAIAIAVTLGACGGGENGAPASAPGTTAAVPATAPAPPGSGTPATPAPQSKNTPAVAPDGSYTPTGPLVADSGFRPNNDGLPFDNYGPQLPDGSRATNMTVDDLRRMFGDSVCVDPGSSKCELIPQGQDWLNSTNSQMDGGHCFGFAVAANRLWQQQANVTVFGAPHTAALSLTNNIVLQRGIASAWATQLLTSVRQAIIKGTPNDILQRLRSALKPNPPETFTIGFTKKDGGGGHAVTPYAVEDKGGGRFNLLIYDNNYQRIARAIELDTNTNTWRYEASINPNSKPALYDGDAGSKNLFLYPTSPGLGPQACPFCATRADASATSVGGLGAAPAATPTAEIYLDGGTSQHSHLLITDGSGRRLGYVNGKPVNEIPGASVKQLIDDRSWQISREPRYVVPARGKYTIVADAKSLETPERETFGIIGPAYAVAVKNVLMRPGDKDTLVADKDGGTVSYATSRSKRFTVRIGVSDQGAHYAVELGAVSRPDHPLARLRLPPETGSFYVDRTNAKGGSAVDLSLTRSTPEGIQRFRHNDITLKSADAAELQYGKWTDESQGMPVVTTSKGHKSTLVLSNQAS